MNREFKILIGKKSTKTSFGIIGCSHGASWGGYINYRYGIKGLFAIGYYKGWGEMKESTNAFN
jgi:hypothetical protein